MSVWHLETADLVGEVEVFRHRGADLVQQLRKVLRTWCDPLVELVHRRVFHELGGGRAHLALLRSHLRIDRVGPDVRRDCYKAANLGRVLGGRMKRHTTAERIADQVGLLEAQLVDEGRDVVGHQLSVDWAIDVSGPAVSLQVGGDDLVALRK